MSLRGYRTGKLAHRTGTEVSGIFITHIFEISRQGRFLFQLFVDLLKIGIADDGLSPNDQFSLKRNRNRNILEDSRVLRNDFADFSVAARDCLEQLPFFIGQDNRQAIELEGEQPFLISQPVAQFLSGFGLVEGKHRFLMPALRQLIDRSIADMNRRRIGQRNTGLLLERYKLVIELVVLEIGHDFLVLRVIRFGRLI